jgi:DeoR family transcriptional regulator, aga operon transcriptional repressor
MSDLSTGLSMEPTPNLSNAERQEQILRLVQRARRVTIPEICRAFGVSEATARRDLELLAKAGQLKRFHGGASAIGEAPPELPIHQRSADQAGEKRRIGQAAAGLVENGQTIFLGSGSTIHELARALVDHRDLTVITNSLLVVNTLAGRERISLVGLGGLFRPSELSFIGHITESALAELRADRVFIGIHAIDVQAGLTNAYLPETMTDRAILRIGREVIVLADHTKCGRVSTAYLAPLTAAHTLITDEITPLPFTDAVNDCGVQVLRV